MNRDGSNTDSEANIAPNESPHPQQVFKALIGIAEERLCQFIESHGSKFKGKRYPFNLSELETALHTYHTYATSAPTDFSIKIAQIQSQKMQRSAIRIQRSGANPLVIFLNQTRESRQIRIQTIRGIAAITFDLQNQEQEARVFFRTITATKPKIFHERYRLEPVSAETFEKFAATFDETYQAFVNEAQRKETSPPTIDIEAEGVAPTQQVIEVATSRRTILPPLSGGIPFVSAPLEEDSSSQGFGFFGKAQKHFEDSEDDNPHKIHKKNRCGRR